MDELTSVVQRDSSCILIFLSIHGLDLFRFFVNPRISLSKFYKDVKFFAFQTISTGKNFFIGNGQWCMVHGTVNCYIYCPISSFFPCLRVGSMKYSSES